MTDLRRISTSGTGHLGAIRTITLRDLQHWRQQPAPVLIGWFFPVLVAVMFGTLFGGAVSTPGAENYYAYLLPGILAVTMFFGLETTMTAVATDAGRGVTDRFRSLPISGVAVVGGRASADMIGSIVGLAITATSGLILGWRTDAGAGAILGACAVLLLLRLSLLWVGIYLGLTVRGTETVAAIQILMWPFMFLSNVFIDPTSMPSWLAAVAQWNPLSATATATRDLFGSPGWESAGWVTDNALIVAIAWPVALLAVFLPLSVRAYRRLGD
ncbi:multidrug ABC transporter permease [Rhodococcus sp. 06-235-1A]|uniref:ABC transporter permease n=1 Tax=Rhodococcus sp. 06-235-1A TaxID=2022508 RepID=UPI000B9C573B|nr:ABC transporter permease [Rhodococcus sp. 06-235-1A]OZD04217.1 multidrug ABC transporter permease [Rhodococcus sp. 06-235-1A]